MPETGLSFRGLALGGRAQHSGERVRGALGLDLEPRRVRGVRRRDAPPRFFDLLALDLSVRSALIGERLIAPALTARGVPEDEAKVWSSTIMALFQTGKKESRPKKDAKKKGKVLEAESDEQETADGVEPQDTGSDAGRQVLVLGQPEVEAWPRWR